MKQYRRLFITAAATIATAAACTAAGITGTEQNASAAAKLSGATLVQCPSNTTTSATAVVGPLGGLVNVGSTSIQIPAGALLSPATVTVTVPASNYMEVDISVQGVEHFIFELPVVVTLDYGRCNRSNIDARPLSVWYIDSESKDLLEPMGGVDNKLLRTITFTTGHLSGYAVAN